MKDVVFAKWGYAAVLLLAKKARKTASVKDLKRVRACAHD